MANKKYTTALVIEGDAKGGIRAVKATEAQLEKLDRQQTHIIATSTRMNKSFIDMRTAAVGAAGGIAAMATGFAVSGMLGYINSTVSATAELGRMADAMNVSAESLQTLRYSFRQFDHDADFSDVRDALGSLTDHVQDLLSGSKSAAQDFALVGLSIEDVRNQNPVELFRTLAEAVASTTDKNKALTVAQRLLGDDLGQKLLPLLSRGTRGLNNLADAAYNAGAVMDDSLTQKAIETNREFEHLTRTIANFGKWAAVNIASGATGVGELLGLFDPKSLSKMAQYQNQMNQIHADLVSATQYRKRLASTLAGVAGVAMDKQKLATIAHLDDKIAGLRHQMNDVNSLAMKLEKTRHAENNSSSGSNTNNNHDILTDAEKLYKKYQDITASLSKQAALYNKTSIVAQMRYRTEFGDLAELTAAHKRGLLMQTREVEALTNRKMAIQGLLPMLVKLRDLSAQADRIDTLGGGSLGNLARKQLQGQIGSMATSGASPMMGLDATISGPFGEMNRLERQHADYQAWYEQRLSALQEFTNTKYGVQAQAYVALEQLQQQHRERTTTHEQQASKARLVGYSSLFGNLADMSAEFAGQQSGIYKGLFIAQKSFSIASSIMSIQTGISKAFSLPFPENLAAAAMVAAQTAGIISKIKSLSLSGQAHDGIDSIPSSGTWNLERGERIIDRRTNVDLKQYLTRANSAPTSNNRGRDVYITAPVTVQAQPGMSAQEANRQGRQIAEGITQTIRRVMVDEKRPGGLLADSG